jgi:UDP-hydrolysing UDP-N-acetyl-D-glucosamine 2-epimerase
VIATGMHLASEFGLTYQELEADGFEISEKVETLLASDSPVAIAKSVALGVIGCAEALARLRPDVVVLLGDRFEILAAAQAALLLGIPIAHIHGGEVTEGSIDEPMRHAITKMSSLHFTAAEPYRKRVIQLGEDPDRVFNVGSLGVDNIERLELLARGDLEVALERGLPSPLILCTYHPVTTRSEAWAGMEAVLEALEGIPEAHVVFTRPNSDTGGREINRAIDEFVRRNPERTAVFVSLGPVRYLSLLREADVVLGNSSSGIIEAPAAGVPTVDVGERQRGRLRADSVIDAREDASEILRALRRALSPEFRANAARCRSWYGRGGSSRKICEVLKAAPLEALRTKRFHDLEVS